MTKARILVVEDEVIIARDIQRTLTRLGYEVPVLAFSGEEALARLDTTQPDLVLMDIHLRGEMDGITAAEHIRNYKALPVVFLTAHSDEATLSRAHITGPYGYVLKPFEERELAIAIDIALYRHNVESKLKQMEHWLATTLKSIGDAVIATDVHGKITFINQMAETLTGWKQVEALGHPFDEVLKLVNDLDRSPAENLVARVLRENMIIQLSPNSLLITRNGAELSVDDSAAPIRNDAGEIIGVVIIFRDISVQNWMENQLRYSAMHDALTGVPNRLLFMDRLTRVFEHSRRHPEFHFAVLYLDLDNFKLINDSWGHLFGDQVLIATARRLESSLRTEDTVARLGGDEFVVLLDGIADARYALQVAERIKKNVEMPIELDGKQVMISTSIGIALSGVKYSEPDNIVRDADTALYRAKTLGKGRYAVFNASLHEQAEKQILLENDLRHAIERDEFRVFYQPIILLAPGQVCGFEALLRWQHPTRGLLQPSEFLGVGEDIGVLAGIGAWMFRETCHQVVAWQEAWLEDMPLTVSVNLSYRQFLHPDLVNHIAEALAETGLDASHLCLEITESMIEGGDTATRTLMRLDELGVQLHLDDFGIGHSSLSMLYQTPIDTLKLAPTFVQRLKEPMVRTILLVARELGQKVIAKGIETAEQSRYLKELNCAYGQGFLFSEPCDAEGALRLIDKKFLP